MIWYFWVVDRSRFCLAYVALLDVVGREFFQRREPVATPCKPTKKIGRSPKPFNALIEKISFSGSDDAEMGTQSNPIDLS